MSAGIHAESNTLPIGILDSGVGGLSILNELRRTLPQERFIYLGDTLNAPYGSRDETEIRALVDRAAAMLYRRGLKALVLGSSTITTVALSYLQSRYELPIIGTSPAVKLAVEATKSGVIGVLSTRATARGELLAELIDEFATPAGVKVLPAWHDDLVPLVERGQVDTPAVQIVLDEVLSPLASVGVDQLVLASTHFTFLQPVIRARFGETFEFVDSAETVARDLNRVLQEQGLDIPSAEPGSVTYLFTGDLDEARSVLVSLLSHAKHQSFCSPVQLNVESVQAG